MRLLYACSDFGIRPDGVKGASIHLRAITAALASRGHEVRLISPHGGAGRDHPGEVLDLGDFGGLRRVLESGSPTVRNKAGGHGQGSTTVTIPSHLAAYALHLCGSNIVFLVEAHKAMK